MSSLTETQCLLTIFRYFPLSALAPPIAEVVLLDSTEATDSTSARPPTMDQLPELTDEAPGPTESSLSLNKEKAQSVKSLSKSGAHSPRLDYY